MTLARRRSSARHRCRARLHRVLCLLATAWPVAHPLHVSGGVGVVRPAFKSRQWRAGNAIVSVLARAGIGPIQLLTTRDRRNGEPHTTPVVPVEQGGTTWLVAPYGTVAWVRNAREDRRVRLRYGRTTRDYVIREVGPDEAGPVLKRYVAIATKTRSQFGATKDSPVEDSAAEAGRHPVFELVAIPADAAMGGTSSRDP
ncbi:MAG TPA: nitroreductase/quinone reductase family protein [Ilumatobacter sp.]|nr:nitroreductase/quinone reductase family protein [Ilumatobacter sp.]